MNILSILKAVGLVKDQHDHSQHIIDWENKKPWEDVPRPTVAHKAVDDGFSWGTDKERNEASYGKAKYIPVHTIGSPHIKKIRTVDELESWYYDE